MPVHELVVVRRDFVELLILGFIGVGLSMRHLEEQGLGIDFLRWPSMGLMMTSLIGIIMTVSLFLMSYLVLYSGVRSIGRSSVHLSGSFGHALEAVREPGMVRLVASFAAPCGVGALSTSVVPADSALSRYESQTAGFLPGR